MLDKRVTESIAASEKAAHPKHGSMDELRAAFDEVCAIATTLRLNIVDHDKAVAKVNEIRARVG